MKIFEQFIHFEALGAGDIISLPQLLLYYLILFALYLLFLRDLKPTYLTIAMLLLFNQGFLESFFGNRGTVIVKALMVFLILIMFIKTKIKNINPKEQFAIVAFIVFTFLFFLGYLINGINLLWGAFQYYKYFVPFSIYYIYRGTIISKEQNDYYTNLFIKLLWFQIAFSVVKLLVIGFRENITGSISNLGGDRGIVLAVMGVITYWVIKNERFSLKDWYFVLLLLLIPIASNKRAIWFLYPIILILLMRKNLSKYHLRTLSVLFLLVPFMVYFGFRLNPSLNPEKKIWGSFDPQYAVDYMLDYSGVSEEKIESEYATGRWGSSLVILNDTFESPFETDFMFGYGRSREGKMSEELDRESLGLASVGMISGIGLYILQMGWIATFLIIIIYLLLIYSVPNRYIAHTVAFYVLWEMFLYGGALINTSDRATVLILSIGFINHHLTIKETNSYVIQTNTEQLSSMANSRKYMSDFQRSL